MSTASGLSKVTDADLQRLLRALHRDLLPAPITRAALIEAAFGHVEEHLDVLVGRDRASAQALVVSVLAERTQQRQGGSTLSVSGPAVPGTLSRDTVEQVRDVIAGAQHSVLLLGVRSEGDGSLLHTLLAIAEPRSVEVTLVLEQGALPAEFDAPESWRRYDASGLALKSRAVVVDRAHALLTSDVLSGREQDDALHLGAVIHDESVVSQLLQELERLVQSGRVRAL